jgi:hypothetical protein
VVRASIQIEYAKFKNILLPVHAFIHSRSTSLDLTGIGFCGSLCLFGDEMEKIGRLKL